MSITVITPEGELAQDQENKYEKILRFEKIKRDYIKSPVNAESAIEYARITGRDLAALGTQSQQEITDIVKRILVMAAKFDIADPEFMEHVKVFDESRRKIYEYYKDL